ncbi:tetratricopeptide repeat protein [Desulfovulcanus sp.]
MTLVVHKKQEQSQDPMGEIVSLMQRLEKEPDNIQVLTALGNRFMFMRVWDKAMNFWARVLAIEPENKMALNQIGVCYFELGKYPQARDTFLKLIKIDNKNYRAYYNLAILYKYYLNDNDEARNYFQKILDAHPDDQQLLEAVQREMRAQKED